MQVRCHSKTGTGTRDFFEVCDEWDIPEAAAQWDAGGHFVAELHGHPIHAYFNRGFRDQELRLFIGTPDPGARAFVWSRRKGWTEIGASSKEPAKTAAEPEQRPAPKARAKAKRKADARGTHVRR